MIQKNDIDRMLLASRAASRTLLELSEDRVNALLCDMADALESASDRILEANSKDLERMDVSDPKYDRLKLTASRISGIASDMRSVAALPSPLHRTLEERVLPNGLNLRKVSVPFGVIGVIYEARPNVSCDVASLCLKSGNACVLKGGHDAAASNETLVEVMHEVMQRHGVDSNAVILLPATREATAQLLQARGMVDLIIPRGSSSLIDFVRKNAVIPVIETGAGVCHAYFDRDGNLDMGAAIVENAKTRRVSVCNALDCLLVHSSRLYDLPGLCSGVMRHEVVIYADDRAYDVLTEVYPSKLLHRADSRSFGTEYLSLAMAVHVVDSIDEAIAHIACYGSGHSECIISDSEAASGRFSLMVDAACVYTNAPTSWTDGAQFGLGAEIGISTQKLHARGPMALREITTYKWLVKGCGQLRS